LKKITFSKLRTSDQELLLAARDAMEQAYNPYSRFFVGAALRTLAGEIITGANVENAAYSAAICAERSALVRAAAMGHTAFARIAVIGRGAKAPTTDVISPCGVCRQMLFESAQLSKKNIEVIMSSTDMKRIVKATIQELLPLGFGPVHLGLDIGRFRR
jgi:cytidine deaminase